MLEKLSFENQVNVFGGIVVALIGVYVLAEVVTTRDNPACMVGYPAYTQMSFANSKGAPLSPPELQARLGVGERGVMQHATIGKSDGPEGLAFDVKVGAPQQNGPAVSFTWAPHNLSNATSTCLSYSFYLPRDFNFSQGGYLPGLYGLGKSSTATQSGFSARTSWSANGLLQMEKNFSDVTAAQQGSSIVAVKDYTLPRGRWVRVDQEIVLNAPNQQNGQLRLWVDGKLRLHEKKLAWRNHASIMVAGVAADVGYAPMKTNILPARPEATIRFSPLQIAWRGEEVKTSSK